MFGKIISTIGTKFLSAILSLVIVVLTTNYLGAEGRGEVSIFVLNIAIVMMVNNFVGGPALIYLVPRIDLLKLIIPSYIWALIISSLLAYVLYLSGLAKPGYAIHLFFIAFIQSLGTFNLMALLGKEKINLHNIVSLLQIVALLVVLFIFLVVLNRKEVFSFVIALYVSNMLGFVLSFLLISRYIKGNSITGMREVLGSIFKFGSFVQLGNIAQLLNYRISYYFLEFFCGKGMVGIYSTGVSIAEGMWMVSKSISMVQYSRISNTNDIEYARKLTITLFKLSLLGTLCMLSVILLLPVSFYTSIFGDEFAEVRTVIFFLATGIVALSISSIFSPYFAGIGKHYINTISSVAGLVITIGLGLILIPRYQLAGAGITATISYTVSTVYQFIVFMRETKVKFRQFMPSSDDVKIIRRTIKDYLNLRAKQAGSDN